MSLKNVTWGLLSAPLGLILSTLSSGVLFNFLKLSSDVEFMSVSVDFEEIECVAPYCRG